MYYIFTLHNPRDEGTAYSEVYVDYLTKNYIFISSKIVCFHLPLAMWFDFSDSLFRAKNNYEAFMQIKKISFINHILV